MKAILSDGGDIIFTNIGQNSVYSFVAKYKNIGYGQFKNGFAKFRQLSNTEKKYTFDDAVTDYLVSLGLENKIREYKHSEERKSTLNHKGRVVIEGVKETLRELRTRKIPFIILSDASLPGDQLMPQLRDMGLYGLIHDIISSKDVGNEKPDPRFFDLALRRNLIEKKDAIFLAHDYDELKGAREYGLETIAFNYDPCLDLSFIPKTHKIDNFHDILKFI